MSAAIAVAPSPAPHDRSSYVDIPHSAAPSSPPSQAPAAAPTPSAAEKRLQSTSPKALSAGKGSPTAYVPRILFNGHCPLPLMNPD